MMPAQIADRRTVLITGAAKRLGRELSLALAKGGWQIAAHYHKSADAALRLCEDILAIGSAAEAFSANLAEPEAAQAMFGQALARFGRIDALINNAAVFEHDDILSLSAESFNRHMQINALSPILLMQAMANQDANGMQAINMLDYMIVKIQRGYCSYGLSKLALARATEMAAKKFAPRMRVNAVAPGIVLPPKNQENNPDWAHGAGSPLLPQESAVTDIICGVEYLLHAQNVNGNILFIDGGRHLQPVGAAI